MSSPEDTNTGPVIRDLRRIDPVTGQVKEAGQRKPKPGKHAASKPGGTSGNGGGGAHRASPPEAAGDQTPGAPGGSGEAGAGHGGGAGNSTPAPAGQPAAGPGPEAAPADPGLASALAERTADLQRITAEYSNYRKRVERDRVAVREQALANVLVSLLPVLDDIGRARQHEELTGGFKSVAESLETIVAKLGLESFGDAGEPFDPNVHEALMHSYSAEVTEPTCVQILQPGYRVGDRILRPARVAVAEPADDAGAASGPPEAPAEQD